MKYINHIVMVLLTAGISQAVADTGRLIQRADRYFDPLPSQMPGSENDSAEKIALGKKLFSTSGSLSTIVRPVSVAIVWIKILRVLITWHCHRGRVVM